MGQSLAIKDGQYLFKRERLDWAKSDRCSLYKRFCNPATSGMVVFLFVNSIDCVTGKGKLPNEEIATIFRENLQLLRDNGLIDAIEE